MKQQPQSLNHSIHPSSNNSGSTTNSMSFEGRFPDLNRKATVTTHKTNQPTVRENNLKKVRSFLSKQPLTLLEGVATVNELNFQKRELVDDIKKYQNCEPAMRLSQSNPRNSQFEDIKSSPYHKTEQTQEEAKRMDVNAVSEELATKNPQLFKKILKAYETQKIKSYMRSSKKESNNTTKTSQTAKQSHSQTKDEHKRKSASYSNNEIQRVIQSSASAEPVDKMTLFRQISFVVNVANQMSVKNVQSTYKAYICKGNNGILVKTILKNRPWWTIVSSSEINSANIVWTEWKKPTLFNLLEVVGEFPRPQVNNNCETSKSVGEKKSFQKVKVIQNLIDVSKYPRLVEQVKSSSAYTFNFHKKLSLKITEDLVKKYALPGEAVAVINNPEQKKCLNHIDGGLHLHSKKLLFLNLKQYYESNSINVFDHLPVTYVVKKEDDEEYQRFATHFASIQEQIQSYSKGSGKRPYNIWICKPGQNSNRGNGIHIFDSLAGVRSLIKSRQGSNRSLIVQKYMDYPFLYCRRKFDIRCYMLVTCCNGISKAYWFDEGYIRTSSKEFTLSNIDNKMVHLTNDAIQKKSEEYGKFEGSNKISFADFQKYLDNSHPDLNIKKTYSTSMKDIARNVILSVASKINPNNKQFNFELFGLDFMLDEKFKPYLIQANSNPCLQVSGTVLGRLIPLLVENVIKLAIDPIFPAPEVLQKNKKNVATHTNLETNKFQLIYDSLFEVVKPTKVIAEVEDQGSEQEANDQE